MKEALNRIYNMDCIEGMERLLNKYGENCVDLVLTDIPYLISKENNFKSIKNFTKKEGVSDYEGIDFGDWDKDFDVERYITLCFKLLKPSRSIIVWSAWQQLKEIEDVLVSLKSKGSSRIGVWEKTNPSVFNMDKMAIQPYEFFIWKRKGSNWVFNNQNEGNKPERHYFRTATARGDHPTKKPVEIFEYLIKTYTNENDIVFDGCMGSGTTAVASKKLNRNFIGFEIDKDYWNVANERVSQ